MEKHCQVDFSDQELVIVGIGEQDLRISLENDVELTGLVNSLIRLYDTDCHVILETTENGTWDDKKKLLFRIIKDIINKYNSVFENPADDTSTSKEEDEDLPF